METLGVILTTWYQYLQLGSARLHVCRPPMNPTPTDLSTELYRCPTRCPDVFFLAAAKTPRSNRGPLHATGQGGGRARVGSFFRLRFQAPRKAVFSSHALQSSRSAEHGLLENYKS